MGLLQRVFNTSNSAVIDLNKRIKKNEDKMWARVGKVTLGENLRTQATGFVSLFLPASYIAVGQKILKLPFSGMRGATMKAAQKTARPLDTSKLPPPKPPRWTPPKA